MINIRDNYWAVEVPDAEGAEIRGEHPGRPYQLLSFYGEADAVPLPTGTWQIICTSKEATAEQITCIIERNGEGWVDYDKDRFHSDIPFPYPMDSFNSLMEAKGCDVNKNWLILKKQ